MDNPVIDFLWIKFISRTKLKHTDRETGRLTISEFNREYQYYKDDFDLELLLRRNGMTYAQLKTESEKQEEWF